jgi:isoamylase
MAQPSRLRPGSPVPLGATWDGSGVNVAIWSEHATAVELCLFDAEDPGREKERIRLTERTDQVWHGRVAGLAPGALYGYRAHGPYAPSDGHRFNPAKLLLDPYARAITGRPWVRRRGAGRSRQRPLHPAQRRGGRRLRLG